MTGEQNAFIVFEISIIDETRFGDFRYFHFYPFLCIGLLIVSQTSFFSTQGIYYNIVNERICEIQTFAPYKKDLKAENHNFAHRNSLKILFHRGMRILWLPKKMSLNDK